MKELCNVEFEIEDRKLAWETSYKDPNSGEKYRDATFLFKVRFTSADVRLEVYYRNEKAASCRAGYRNLI